MLIVLPRAQIGSCQIVDTQAPDTAMFLLHYYVPAAQRDEVIVWKWDRAVSAHLALIDDLEGRTVNLRSVTEGITKTGPLGRLCSP